MRKAYKGCSDEVNLVLNRAEAVFFMAVKLDEKYKGYSSLTCVNDNPIPWIHTPHGVLYSEEIGPALFQEIITAMQEEYKYVNPESYATVKTTLTQNSGWETVKENNFPDKTDEEIILLYIADSIRLCEKCTALIKRLEKLIQAS